MEVKRTEQLINRKYMEYFIPTVMTALANNLAIMVDGTIVGNILGGNALAAVNLLSPVTQLYFALSILFGLGSSTIIARMKGENGSDHKSCNQVFTVTFISVLLLSIVLMSGQLLLLDRLVSTFTTNAELQVLLKKYYLPYILGSPVTFMMSTGIYLVRTDGRPKFASNIIIISNVINLSMDLILMLGFGMDITGASIATVTGNLVGLILLISHFLSKKNTLFMEWGIFKQGTLLGKQLMELFTTGFSGALGTMLITIRMYFLNTSIQLYGGKSAIVAYSVVSMCQIFISAFITGASQTMIPIVSLLLGERDYTGVKYTFRKAFSLLTVSSLVILGIVEVFPGTISTLYGIRTSEDLSMAVSALRITSLLFPAMAYAFLGLYYFMCTDKKKASTMISIVNGVVLIIPACMILGRLFGITGIWVALVVAQVGTMFFAILCAFWIKARSGGMYKNLYLLEEDAVVERAAFSVDLSQMTASELGEDIRAVSDGKTAELVSMLSEKIKSADFEKHQKRKLVDVRICEEKGFSVIIKCMGAELREELFRDMKSIVKDLSYAKALGFHQIKIHI